MQTSTRSAGALVGVDHPQAPVDRAPEQGQECMDKGMNAIDSPIASSRWE